MAPRQGAFRAGQAGSTQWDDVNIGLTSVPTGYETVASGSDSIALGFGTSASGQFSTAMGFETLASGCVSTAMGFGSHASGRNSTAIGDNTTASGSPSLAMGDQIRRAASAASRRAGDPRAGAGHDGDGHVARATGAAQELFVYGDRSTVNDGNAVVTSVTPNQFLVRAAGGVMFWSTAATTFPNSPGVALLPGDSAWSILSDVNSKEHFRDLDGEDVLGKLTTMPVREWSYKAQSAAIRHVGPTAQDFHAAFGLGAEPRRINTIDADGVALAAVKALEARTRELRDGDRALNERISALTRENHDLRARLARLEALLEKR